jgi:xylulokinase
MVDWFARLLHGSEEGAGFLTKLEPQCSTTPSGLCITPHLLGTSNPDFDPAASAVIAGIRPGATQADLYKGILEGVACEFATMAELLQQAAGPFDDVYVSGGGGRSHLGLELRASIAQKSLHLTQCQEAVCLGTAILAGVAIGKYKSYSQAVEQAVRTSQTIAPDPLLSKQYESQKKKYYLLYSSLAPFRDEQRKAAEES